MATAVQGFSTQAIAHELRAVPEVLKVFLQQEGYCVHVWTVTSSFQRKVRDRIYDIERNIFARFPEYKFDFHVVQGDNETAIADAKLVYAA